MLGYASKIHPWSIKMDRWTDTMRSMFFYLIALLCVSCQDHCPPEGCNVEGVIFTLTSEKPLSRFQLILDIDSKITVINCPKEEETDPSYTCFDGRVWFKEKPFSLGITAKASGMTTLHTLVHPVYEDNRAIVHLVLKPLPPPMVTEDYITGFVADQGLEMFKSLAYPATQELGQEFVVKFYIDGIPDNPEVYFQNTLKHPIHYDFVHDVLGKPISPEEFVEKTYISKDRKAMAGSIIWRPSVTIGSKGLKSPFTIEFFPSDTLSPSQAAIAVNLIQERMPFSPLVGTENVIVYLPAGSIQESQAEEEAHTLAAAGVIWLRRMELFSDIRIQILNPGLAYGTLKVMSPEELSTSIVSFKDILILTRLPNNLPIVGGTITEELQTPLAHVNVAARARGTPNIAFIGASKDKAIEPLIGKLCRFEVNNGAFTLTETTLAEAEEFWEKHASPEKLVPDADVTKAPILGFNEIGFKDAKRVGVKAANLAEMSHFLQGISPSGFAIPFYYYHQFLQNTTISNAMCESAGTKCLEDIGLAKACDAAINLCKPPSGNQERLQDYIHRLINEHAFKTDSETRFASLYMLRRLFCLAPIDPDFSKELDERVAKEFGTKKVRLRSSTNAEDLPKFSGAGLYSSYSAQVNSDKPPSKRICKTWGSVWNWTAFEERSFWNIEHESVFMGVAVHQAFPEEQANGVLITQNIADPLTVGMYVNVQLGEVSVTNPVNGAIPEIFSIIQGPSGKLQVARQRFSSLSPDKPILTDEEIAKLYVAAMQIQKHFAPLYGIPEYVLKLDLEFKFHGQERNLIIKQVRPYYQKVM